MPNFIVYACPTGALAEQIQHFFDQSRQVVGANAAHQYPPHCTLVGFFEDTLSSVPLYTRALTRAYKRSLRSQPHPPLAVKGLSFRPDWHGLELESPWLRRLMVDFTCTVASPTRKGTLRLKSWLRLSLACEFPPEQARALAELALQRVDPAAPVGWELRYYQRSQDQHWTCHQVLPLN